METATKPHFAYCQILGKGSLVGLLWKGLRLNLESSGYLSSMCLKYADSLRMNELPNLLIDKGRKQRTASKVLDGPVW